MKGKHILVITLSAIVFLASVWLGIAGVYRISAVEIDPTTYSAAAEQEARQLQQRLRLLYDKRSFFATNEQDAATVIAEEFPYFRMTRFEKSAPNRIIVSVVEDEEVYAMPVGDTSDSYYVLGIEGVVLGIRESYVNRLDGGDNLCIKGLQVQGEKGKPLGGDEILPSLFEFCKRMSERLDGIRRNVVLIEVVRPTSSTEDTIVRLSMAEGVKIYVGNIFELTAEKADRAVEKYLALDDQERMTGRIMALSNNGQIVIGYAKNDDFPY